MVRCGTVIFIMTSLEFRIVSEFNSELPWRLIVSVMWTVVTKID